MKIKAGYLVQAILTLVILSTAPALAAEEKAMFAGGCFWCMESEFEDKPGVSAVHAGYAGGTVPHPTYEQVSSGRTGHLEVVEVTYDPARVSYQELLSIFWSNVDPLDAAGQFCDKGAQYAAAIFAANADEKALAEASRDRLEKRLGQKIVTLIRTDPAIFYPAEDKHQDYYRKNAARYERYKKGCGREERLEKVWGRKG